MTIDATCFEPFVYAKQEHLPFLKSLAPDLYGKAVSDWQAESLKTYQDLFTYAFIRHNIPKGSRLLEVGGGYSRVLTRLADEYTCWNIDRFEGLGAGPITIPEDKYRIVRDYMGTFNPELPDESFDFVFSISVLEHVPTDSPTEQEAVLKDIPRVLRPSGISLHLVDVVAFQDSGWYPPIVDLASKMFSLAPPPPAPAVLANDPQLYCMSREAYESQWRPITKTPYERFGRPTNINLLWRKQQD